MVEHGAQLQAADLGQRVGHLALQPGLGAGAGDFVLGEVGDLGHSHGFAHRLAFGLDVREVVGAVERHHVLGLGQRGREPQRRLHAPRIPHDRALFDELVVQRSGLQRTACGQFFVRKADAKAPRIVLAHLGVGIGAGGPVAIARNVHAPDVKAGVAVDHPVGERQPDAAALAETGHHAAGTPEIGATLHGTYQRVAVGCEGEGAIDDAFDARVFQGREVLEGDLQRGRNAVQVGLQQLLAKAPGRGFGGPGLARLLVHAQDHALAFLAQIALGAKVDHVADFLTRALIERFHLRNIVGHQIHVFHGQHRQLNAHHAAHFARPQAAGVDHVLALDHAFVGDHAPGAVGLLLQTFHLGLHFDGGAANTRRLGVGVGGAAGVEVAFVGVEQGA